MLRNQVKVHKVPGWEPLVSGQAALSAGLNAMLAKASRRRQPLHDQTEKGASLMCPTELAAVSDRRDCGRRPSADDPARLNNGRALNSQETIPVALR